MAEKRYVVRLNEDERTRLRGVVTANRVAAQKRARAQVLLKVDEGADGPAWTDGATAAAFDLHVNTVVCLRRRLVERGFEAALEPPPRVWRPRKLTPAVEFRNARLECPRDQAGRADDRKSHLIQTLAAGPTSKTREICRTGIDRMAGVIDNQGKK